MRWLLRLFRRKSKPTPIDPHSLKSGEIWKAGTGELIQAWRLNVTMSPRTPLEWLLRHGEEAAEGCEVPAAHAIWVPVTRSWRELGFDFDEVPPGTMASAVGQIPVDGGDFLPFLIRYRWIVENTEPEDHEPQIDALLADHPEYAEVIRPKPKLKRLRKSRSRKSDPNS